jgi:hypothetical protein
VATVAELVRGVDYAMGSLVASGWRRYGRVPESFPGDRNADHYHTWSVQAGTTQRRAGERLQRPAGPGGQVVTTATLRWSALIRADRSPEDYQRALSDEVAVLEALAAYPVQAVTVGAHLAGGTRCHVGNIAREVLPIEQAGSNGVALVFVGTIELEFFHEYVFAVPQPPPPPAP